MQILCPFCSQERPRAIPLREEDSFVLCDNCKKRFRVHTFLAEEIDSQKKKGRYTYTCLFDGGLQKFYSATPLQLRKGNTLTLVRRGRDVLGVADQKRDRWYPVTPPRSNHPLLRALGLSLAWPVSLLAFLQLLRLADKSWALAPENPLAWLAAGLLLCTFLLAPRALWLIRALFPQGPGRERIKGYDPRL